MAYVTIETRKENEMPANVKVTVVDSDTPVQVTLSTDPGNPVIIEAGQEQTFPIDNISEITIKEHVEEDGQTEV